MRRNKTISHLQKVEFPGPQHLYRSLFSSRT